MWKANYQQQVEASASAVSAAPDAEESGRLADALQEAREEASLWKEKASATEQLQGTCAGCLYVSVDKSI